MTLPDEEGRFWFQAQWTDVDREKVESSVCTLLSVDEDGELDVLGSGFVIRADGNQALCLGAKHSFDVVKERQRRRTASGYAGVPPDFLPRGTHYVDTTFVKAQFLFGHEAVVCDVRQYDAIESYDVAVFTVVAPEELNPFDWRFPLDLREPEVGEELALIAHDMKLRRNRRVPGESIIESSLDLRIGAVTEVVHGPSSMPGQSFVFRATFPVTPGMSGAPVISFPGPSLPMAVRGVVSSDHFSPDEAFQSYLTSATAAVSLLWPAMALRAEIRKQSDPSSYIFLGTMAQNGMLKNLSNRVAVHVSQSGETIETRYIDDRESPPREVVLELKCRNE